MIPDGPPSRSPSPEPRALCTLCTPCRRDHADARAASQRSPPSSLPFPPLPRHSFARSGRCVHMRNADVPFPPSPFLPLCPLPLLPYSAAPHWTASTTSPNIEAAAETLLAAQPPS